MGPIINLDVRRGLPVEYSYSIKDSFYLKMCISFLFFFFKKLGEGGGEAGASSCVGPDIILCFK